MTWHGIGLRVALVALVCAGGCKKKAPPRLVETSFELANGLKVDLVSGPCGDGVDLVTLYEVGSDHDPPERSGLVAVAATLVGFAHGADHLVTARTVPPDGLTAALHERLVVGSGIVPADVDGARKTVLAELARRRGGDPLLTAMTYAAESVRPTRGDGWRGGIAEQLAAVTDDELRAFWAAYPRPRNGRLVVVGRFDPAALRTWLETSVAPLAPGAAPVLRPAVDATVTGTLVMGDAPTTVAIAVPAPPPSSPLFAPFLILAARVPAAAGPTAASASLQLTYDPLTDPALLLVTAPLQPGERPEAGAERVRAELAAVLARPFTRDDVAAARQRFATFLGPRRLDVAAWRADRRGLALGRARRAQLGIDGAALGRALDGATADQLAEAAALFDAKRTAAVVAGGTIR